MTCHSTNPSLDYFALVPSVSSICCRLSGRFNLDSGHNYLASNISCSMTMDQAIGSHATMLGTGLQLPRTCFGLAVALFA